MPDEPFGPFLSGADVERWARDTLKRWAPEYIAWAERSTGRAPRSLPFPKTYVTATGLDKWPEDRLPCVLILSTGLADPPVRRQGKVSASFALGFAIVVSDSDREKAEELAKVYTAALRDLLIHEHTLGGHAEAVDWLDERYDAVPGDARSRRQLAAGQAVFRVNVEAVASTRRAQLGHEPRQDPYSPPPAPPVVAPGGGEVVLDPQE